MGYGDPNQVILPFKVILMLIQTCLVLLIGYTRVSRQYITLVGRVYICRNHLELKIWFARVPNCEHSYAGDYRGIFWFAFCWIHSTDIWIFSHVQASECAINPASRTGGACSPVDDSRQMALLFIWRNRGFVRFHPFPDGAGIDLCCAW